MTNFLDPKKAAEIVRLWKAGNTMRDIHNITGATVSTISGYVKKAGFEVQRGFHGKRKPGEGPAKAKKKPEKRKKAGPAPKAASKVKKKVPPPPPPPKTAAKAEKKVERVRKPEKGSCLGDVMETLHEVSLTGKSRAEAADLLREEIENPASHLAASMVVRIFRMMRSFVVEWRSLTELLDALGYPLMPIEEQATFEEDFEDLREMRLVAGFILGREPDGPSLEELHDRRETKPAPRLMKRPSPAPKKPAPEKMPLPTSVAPAAPAPSAPAPLALGIRKSQFDKEKVALEKHTAGYKPPVVPVVPVKPKKPVAPVKPKKRAWASEEEKRDVPDAAVAALLDVLNSHPGSLMSIGGIVEVVTKGSGADTSGVRNHIISTLQKAEDLGLVEEIDDDGRLLYRSKGNPTSATTSDPLEG